MKLNSRNNFFIIYLIGFICISSFIGLFLLENKNFVNFNNYVGIGLLATIWIPIIIVIFINLWKMETNKIKNPNPFKPREDLSIIGGLICTAIFFFNFGGIIDNSYSTENINGLSEYDEVKVELLNQSLTLIQILIGIFILIGMLRIYGVILSSEKICESCILIFRLFIIPFTITIIGILMYSNLYQNEFVLFTSMIVSWGITVIILEREKLRFNGKLKF